MRRPSTASRRVQALRPGRQWHPAALRARLPHGGLAGDEENPFHTEVGYWLWDATRPAGHALLPHPRGSALIAGAQVAPDATTYTLSAVVGSETYGILSNNFLAAQARTIPYEVTIDISEDGVFSYEETSMIEHGKLPEHLSHTDRNTLRRIADA